MVFLSLLSLIVYRLYIHIFFMFVLMSQPLQFCPTYGIASNYAQIIIIDLDG